MKKLKFLFSCCLVTVFCLLSSVLFDLSACTQSHIPCYNNEPGLALICGGPEDGTCYAGGCGAPVEIVECDDDPIE